MMMLTAGVNTSVALSGLSHHHPEALCLPGAGAGRGGRQRQAGQSGRVPATGPRPQPVSLRYDNQVNTDRKRSQDNYLFCYISSG